MRGPSNRSRVVGSHRVTVELVRSMSRHWTMLEIDQKHKITGLEHVASHHCALAFGSIPFCLISLSSALSRCSSRGGVIVRGTPSTSTSTSTSHSWFTPWCYTYCSWPTTTSNPPPASAMLVCHISWYLTCTYTYLLFQFYLLYLSPCILAHTCRRILILSSSDPLLVPHSALHPTQLQ